MKKIIIILLGILVLNISACGTKEESSEVVQEVIATEAEVVEELPEEVSEETIEEVVEEVAKEEIIEVNMENVTITPQENWELVSYDEVAQNVKYVYDSNDINNTASFLGMEIYNKCEIEGAVNYYEKEQEGLVQETTQDNPKNESVKTEENKILPVEDTGHYITMEEAYELGISVDLTDKTTVVTDGNPNYTILRNGPGPIVKSSYPYIGKVYGDYGVGEYVYGVGQMPGEIVIHSTDYYGAPIHITILGEDLIFTDRIWFGHNVLGANGNEFVEWNLTTEDGLEVLFSYNYMLDMISMDSQKPIGGYTMFRFVDHSAYQ